MVALRNYLILGNDSTQDKYLWDGVMTLLSG